MDLHPLKSGRKWSQKWCKRAPQKAKIALNKEMDGQDGDMCPQTDQADKTLKKHPQEPK